MSRAMRGSRTRSRTRARSVPKAYGRDPVGIAAVSTDILEERVQFVGDRKADYRFAVDFLAAGLRAVFLRAAGFLFATVRLAVVFFATVFFAAGFRTVFLAAGFR